LKFHRILPPLLAGATLILLASNALPTVLRKHRLQRERHRLVKELRLEQERSARLRAEIEALRGDPFYLERVALETWGGTPSGAVRWDAADREAAE